MPSHSPIPLYQWYSAYLATVEMTLGAVLHAARIPLTGYILSLHQAFCLARAARQDCGLLTPVNISITVAILKLLSPMGKKITPMIAIMAQGFLFNGGILLLGNNLAGHLLGAALLSLWGFIQPLLFAALIFGKDLFAGLATLDQLIPQYIPGVSLVMIFVGIVGLKVLLAMGAVIAAKSSLAIEHWIHQKLSPYHLITAQEMKHKSLVSSLGKDLTSVWFLFSLMTVAIYSWGRNDPFLQGFLSLTGYLFQAILLFMALRFLNPQKMLAYFDRKGISWLSSHLSPLLGILVQEQTFMTPLSNQEKNT